MSKATNERGCDKTNVVETKGNIQNKNLHVATSHLSHPDSRSDPIGGSEASAGCETIYWDSFPDFFLFFFYN